MMSFNHKVKSKRVEEDSVTWTVYFASKRAGGNHSGIACSDIVRVWGGCCIFVRLTLVVFDITSSRGRKSSFVASRITRTIGRKIVVF